MLHGLGINPALEPDRDARPNIQSQHHEEYDRYRHQPDVFSIGFFFCFRRFYSRIFVSQFIVPPACDPFCRATDILPQIIEKNFRGTKIIG
jgi:hypothetical protein